MFHHLKNGKIWALVVLLVIGSTLAIWHNAATSAGKPFPPEDAVRVVLKPFQSLFRGIGGMFESAKRSVSDRRSKDQLSKEVRALSMEVRKLREDSGEVKRLRSELAFKEAFPERLVAARVISWDPSQWFRTITIDCGRNDGVMPGQAVVTHRGLVGQILEASPTSAVVRSISDGKSGVGAIDQRSRAVGICVGQDDGGMKLTYLGRDADVKIGDIIVTSGEGGVVPKGLPVGRVMRMETESGGIGKSAVLRPSVQIDGTEEVFVVLRKVE